MDETQHHSDDGHKLAGPHQLTGDGSTAHGAVPTLRLLLLPDGRPIDVTRPMILVGRHSDVELRLAYPQVSRRHCRLLFEDGLWHVYDLDSRNGLFINGERMHQAALYEGDQIRVGEVTFLVTAAPQPSRGPAPDEEMLRSIAAALPHNDNSACMG